MNAGLTAQIAELARYDPEAARGEIVAAGLKKFGAGLVDALEPGAPCRQCKRRKYQVWAYRTFAKVAKLVGADVEVNIALQQLIGVPVEAARLAVRMVREVEAMDEHEKAQECAEFLRRYNAAHPNEAVAL